MLFDEGDCHVSPPGFLAKTVREVFAKTIWEVKHETSQPYLCHHEAISPLKGHRETYISKSWRSRRLPRLLCRLAKTEYKAITRRAKPDVVIQGLRGNIERLQPGDGAVQVDGADRTCSHPETGDIDQGQVEHLTNNSKNNKIMGNYQHRFIVMSG